MSEQPPVRVLVVDDSAFNRRRIEQMLGSHPEIEVVGRATDGEEALRLCTQLRPNIITLDLEMPKMDGFAFLRILMSKMPTPVIIVSSYSQKENVFRALELGALDFIAKPEHYRDSDIGAIQDELINKVLLARSLRTRALHATLQAQASLDELAKRQRDSTTKPSVTSLVAIASSTGGPSALLETFSKLPRSFPGAILIAQHMPDKFTRTFAERLDRRSGLRVAEAQDQDEVGPTMGFVCPGRHCMTLEGRLGSELRLRVRAPSPEDRYVPSADRLFESVAKAAGRRAIGVILTGMGDDGVVGARAIVDAGGVVVAESEETAVVYGMPGAAVRRGVVARSLPLPEIAAYLVRKVTA